MTIHLKFAKPKKPSKSKLQKQCDILFSILVRSVRRCEASQYTKVHCGGQLQCAHIISRSNRRLRWDTMNAICMCAGHHRYFTTKSEAWYWDFLPKYFPDKSEYVKKYRNDIVANLNLEAIRDDLQRHVDALQMNKK